VNRGSPLETISGSFSTSVFSARKCPTGVLPREWARDPSGGGDPPRDLGPGIETLEGRRRVPELRQHSIPVVREVRPGIRVHACGRALFLTEDILGRLADPLRGNIHRRRGRRHNARARSRGRPRLARRGLSFQGNQTELERHDIACANLESPFLLEAGSFRRQGHLLQGGSRGRTGDRRAGFDFMSLANNHSLDWGPYALADTMTRLTMPNTGMRAPEQTPTKPARRRFSP